MRENLYDHFYIQGVCLTFFQSCFLLSNLGIKMIGLSVSSELAVIYNSVSFSRIK